MRNLDRKHPTARPDSDSLIVTLMKTENQGFYNDEEQTFNTVKYKILNHY